MSVAKILSILDWLKITVLEHFRSRRTVAVLASIFTVAVASLASATPNFWNRTVQEIGHSNGAHFTVWRSIDQKQTNTYLVDGEGPKIADEVNGEMAAVPIVPSECVQLFENPPLSNLKSKVLTGYGSAIDDHRHGQPLVGKSCTKQEITNFMREQGFDHRATARYDEVQSSGAGAQVVKFDRILSYCAPPVTFIGRILGNDCGVGASFYLLGDTISQISAAASK